MGNKETNSANERNEDQQRVVSNLSLKDLRNSLVSDPENQLFKDTLLDHNSIFSFSTESNQNKLRDTTVNHVKNWNKDFEKLLGCRSLMKELESHFHRKDAFDESGIESLLSSNLNPFPLSCSGIVVSIFSSEDNYGNDSNTAEMHFKIGNGTLISEYCIITSSSSLYSNEFLVRNNQQSVSKTTYFIVRSLSNEHGYYVYKADDLYISESYVAKGVDDIALICVEVPIGLIFGYCGFSSFSQNANLAGVLPLLNIVKKKLNPTTSEVTAYIANNMDNIQVSNDTVRINTQNSVSLSSSPCLTGNPVFFNYQNNYLVLGIQTGDKECLLLNKDRISKIQTWARNYCNKMMSKNTLISVLSFKSSVKVSIDEMLSLKLPKLQFLNLTRMFIGDIGLDKLITTGNDAFPFLRRIILEYNNITLNGIKLLSEQAKWPELEHVRFSNNDPFPAKAISYLNSSLGLSFLKVLDLSFCRLNDYGLKELAKNEFSSLEEIDLRKSEFTNPSSFGFFAANSKWVNLKVINIGFNSLSSEFLCKLTTNQTWISLKSLIANDNLFEPASEKEQELKLNYAIKSLLNSTFKELEKLDLSYNKLRFFKEIQNCFCNLRFLNLAGTKMGINGAEELAKNTTWTNLTDLIISDNEIEDNGIDSIAKNKTWKNLKNIDVSNNGITETGAMFLAYNESWENLQEINLNMNQIGDTGARLIFNNGVWKKLRKVVIQNHMITNKLYKELKKQRPNVDIMT